MATYQSTTLQLNRPLRGPGIGGARGGFLLASIDVPAGATTSDVLQFGNLPTNARVLNGWIKSTDMDTNGSPTIAINVGDAGNASRFFAASNVAQAGTVSTVMAATGYNAVFTSKTMVTGALSTAAATGAAGTITLYLQYVCEEPV